MTSRVNCKYHPDANLIEDYRAGDTICGDCGMVVGDRSVNNQSLIFILYVFIKPSKDLKQASLKSTLSLTLNNL